MSAGTGRITSQRLDAFREQTATEGFNTVAFNEIVALAEKEPVFSDKKVAFEEAFTLIKSHLPDQNKSLFKLFHSYASSILYNQTIDGDARRGFLQSARLMELSIALQLKEKNLFDVSVDPETFDSLETLVLTLEMTPIQILNDEGKVPVSIERIAQEFKEEERSALADTFIRLNFSQQNHPSYNRLKLPRDPSAKADEYHFNSITYTKDVIGSETLAQRQVLAEYCYNCDQLVIKLENIDPKVNPVEFEQKALTENSALFQALEKNYQNLIVQFNQCYKEHDPIFIGKSSQINNMLGILYYGSGQLETAEKHHRLAFATRELLVNDPSQEAKKAEHLYLLSNIRTSLIHELLNRDPTKERALEAVEHAKALTALCMEYARNGNTNTYVSSWMSAAQHAMMRATPIIMGL